jgi:predicted transcriptional regulator YdeE
MKPSVILINEQKVIGIEARTSNFAEANPQTAKIPALWQKFFLIEKKISNRQNADIIIALYTNYESDYTGEYSIIVSAKVGGLEAVPNDLVGAVIPTARYLMFGAEGQMPFTLIETWERIWQYFSDNFEYQRTYTTDFELHNKSNESKVDVYIAIN